MPCGNRSTLFTCGYCGWLTSERSDRVDPMLSVRAVERMAARYICHTTRRFLLRIRLSPIEIDRMPRSRITLEANRQPVAIGTVLQPVDCPSRAIPLETEFEKRTIMELRAADQSMDMENPGRSRFGEHRTRLRVESSSAAGHSRRLGVQAARPHP